jgi:hypothetical protein
MSERRKIAIRKLTKVLFFSDEQLHSGELHIREVGRRRVSSRSGADLTIGASADEAEAGRRCIHASLGREMHAEERWK